MESEQETKRADGLVLIQSAVQQFPGEGLLRLNGITPEGPIDVYTYSIQKIMGWSGVTVADARNALEATEGPHKDEVLQALTRIETELQRNHK